MDPLTFWVRPASSQISRVTAVSVREGTRVRGRAMAGDLSDRSAATGVVEIRFAKNRRWGARTTHPSPTALRPDGPTVDRPWNASEGDPYPMLVVLTGVANGPGAVRRAR